MPISPRVRSRIALVAAAAAATAAVAGAPLAGAHDSVVGGDPANGEVLQEFPDSVTLEFSGRPKDGFNTFAITEAESGEVIYSGEPTVTDRNVTLDLPEGLEAGSGDYRIGFQITSSDGHSTRGTTDFSVAGDGTDAVSDTSAEDAEGTDDAEAAEASAAEEEGVSTTLQIVLAAVGILVLLSVVALTIVKQRRRDEDNR